ncbi:MAG TPA: hypothetical protein VGR91_12400 [Stellaceae bacterium]|nr:hypothetical protein [Stellaceae bacterium]
MRTRRSATTASAAPISANPDSAATTRLIRLDEGLYALGIGEITETGTSPELDGMSLPAIQISAPPAEEFDPVELVATTAEGGWWLGAQGGSYVVKAPHGGGLVLLTAYGTPADRVPLDIHRLERPGRPAPARAAAAAPYRERELPAEITLHIERAGDRQFVSEGWVGARGQRLRIEAFSIRPLEILAPADIEYMAFGPNGRETPWVSDAKLCGTRGRGLPLTGFAVRLAPHLSDRFEAVYEGSFFTGGVSGPQRNGEPCLSSVPDDPLEAMQFRLIERAH